MELFVDAFGVGIDGFKTTIVRNLQDTDLIRVKELPKNYE
jgi:hypothetical protein